MQKFTGTTEEGNAPFLSAGYWGEGATFYGRILDMFDTENGVCYLAQPLDGDNVSTIPIDGKDCGLVSIGNLTGFVLALRAAQKNGLDELKKGDRLYLYCTGRTPSRKQGNSDRVDFRIEVERGEEARAKAF